MPTITRHYGMATYGAMAPLTTTINTVVDVGVLSVMFLKTKRLVFVGATNHLLVTVLGSMDGGLTFPELLEAEFAVNAAATVSKVYTTVITHLKVQVRPAVAAAHGTLTTTYFGTYW